MNAIELKEISKIYNNSVVAVDNVSLTVNQGEFYCRYGTVRQRKKHFASNCGFT